MTRHLWVLVVLPWDGFLVSFSVGLFPSGVGCRRLYCGSWIFVSRVETVESPIELIPVLWKLMCQLLLRSLSFSDSWGGSLWLRRQLGLPVNAVNLLLLRQHLGFRRRPILYKLSSVWFAVGHLVSCSDSNFHRPVFGGIGRDPSDFCFWGGSLVLQSLRRVTVEIHQILFSEVDLLSLNAAVGCCRRFVIEAASVLTDLFI
jgi:hypothetical protein